MPRLMVKSQVKQNLDLWLNDLFLKQGFFTDVSTGETDIYSRDISQLSSVDDPSFPDNTVWQSAFKQWVHESGLVPDFGNITSPIIASGVTVDGTFYPTDPSAPGYNAAYAHNIDFPNGRVIFSGPVSSTSVVQAEFSYKEITVDFASTFENESKDFFIETAYKDHPHQTGVIVYPEDNARTLPMVLIDVTSMEREAYELGAASTIANIQGSFIVWARDEFMRDQIEELLSDKEHTVLFGINFNTAPFPLTYIGDKNPNYTNYEDFARATSPYFYRRLYLDEISTRRLQPYYNIERVQVSFTIRVYPIF